MSAPKSDWQSDLSKINDELASIFVDLDYVTVAPCEGMTKLNWLWIKLNDPRDDGLSTNDEFDSLCLIEDELWAELGDERVCKYVGRVTTDGRREFYFYSQTDFDFGQLVDTIMSGHPDYLFQSGEKADEEWRHYFNTLFPGENGLKQIRQRSGSH